jgi:AraC-like DNA-binding protein
VRTSPDWCYWRTPAALLIRYAPEPAVSDFFVTRSGYFPRCWHNSAWRPDPLPLGEAVVSLCLAGRGWVTDVQNPEGPKTPIVPGEVLVVPSKTPHSYGADEKDPWTQLWFHATGPRLTQFLAQLRVKDKPFKGRLSQTQVVKESVHRMNELRLQGCGRAVLLESAALGELVLARLYAEACLEPAYGGVQAGLQREAVERLRKLKRVTSFLQENFHRELSVAQAAQACQVSESWLYHVFPEQAGFSPLGFVIHLRLQEACRLLATSDRKLDDIAASVGYDDPFYFSRIFKKHLGLSPSGYRREYIR